MTSPPLAPLSAPASIGRDQFAYLRACASGVPRGEAARRYLGLEPGPGLYALHRQWIDRLRAVARQRGDTRWRWLGTTPRARPATGGPQGAEAPSVPPLEQWVVEHGWEDWSLAEQLEAYTAHVAELRSAARAPSAPPPAAPLRIDLASRAQQRLHRLQQQQLALLRDLEQWWSSPTPRAVAQARAEDPVAAWFDSPTAARLVAAQLLTLGQLQRAVQGSARWFEPVKAIGEGKARRIEALLAQWLPDPAQERGTGPGVRGWQADWASCLQSPGFDGSQGRLRAEPGAGTPTNDESALAAWLASLAARAPATCSAYRREVERWRLWCVVERGRPMSSCDVADCRAYLAFLADVPQRWQSRRSADRCTPGWTPFRGSLAPQSRRFAVRALHLFCDWLVERAGYLTHNPWAAVERWRWEGTPEERPLPPQARVLPLAALQALTAALPDPARPGASRNGLLLTLCALTGLKASELLAARAGDLVALTGGGWALDVRCRGRGSARRVVLPDAAVRVLEQSMVRGAAGASFAACSADAPLLGTTPGSERAPSYSALHQAFKRLVSKAAHAAATLPSHEHHALTRTTQQWLRHTFAVRSAADHMPVELLRHHLGHADTRRVRCYYRRDGSVGGARVA